MNWGFHDHLHVLKDLARTGWLQRQVERPESVAAHSFAVALLAILAALERGLDPGRAALLALLHDLPEALVGDRVPGELSPEEKHQREAEAIRLLDEQAGAGGWLVRGWEEYEQGDSPEAKLVRAMDLADAVLQAAAYAQEGRVAAGGVDDLLQSCLARIADGPLRGSLESCLARSAGQEQDRG